VTAAQRWSASALYWIGEPVMFAIHSEDAMALLGRLGYRVLEVADAAALEKRYVRDHRRVYAAAYLVHAAIKASRRVRKAADGERASE
jgi:hypothetical protein